MAKNRISYINFSDLQWMSNELRSEFDQLLGVEIVETNYHKNVQVPKWVLQFFKRRHKSTKKAKF